MSQTNRNSSSGGSSECGQQTSSLLATSIPTQRLPTQYSIVHLLPVRNACNRRGSFTSELKQEILDFYKRCGSLRGTATKYNVSRMSIRRWLIEAAKQQTVKQARFQASVSRRIADTQLQRRIFASSNQSSDFNIIVNRRAVANGKKVQKQCKRAQTVAKHLENVSVNKTTSPDRLDLLENHQEAAVFGEDTSEENNEQIDDNDDFDEMNSDEASEAARKDFNDTNERQSDLDSESSSSTNPSFELGFEPERILGHLIVQGERYFMMKWKNCLTPNLVLSETAKEKCPKIVFNYYEEEFVDCSDTNCQ